MSLSRPRLGGSRLVLRLGMWGMHSLATIVVAIVILGLFPSTASAEPRWLGRVADPHDVPNDPNCGGSFGPLLRVRHPHGHVEDQRRGQRTRLPHDHPSLLHGARGLRERGALDTRGGPRADYREYLDQARLAEETPGGPGRARCGVRPARPDSHIRLGGFRHLNDGSVATCRVPLRWVKPTRSIRWHVWTEDLFPQPYSTLDVSPDRGWWSG